MIFHENPLPADDSREISYLFFFRKLEMVLHNLSSAAVVIGSLRVKGKKSHPLGANFLKKSPIYEKGSI